MSLANPCFLMRCFEPKLYVVSFSPVRHLQALSHGSLFIRHQHSRWSKDGCPQFADPVDKVPIGPTSNGTCHSPSGCHVNHVENDDGW